MMVCGEKGERNSLALRFRVHTHTLTLAYEEGRPLFVYGREPWEIMVESVGVCINPRRRELPVHVCGKVYYSNHHTRETPSCPIALSQCHIARGNPDSPPPL